MSALPTRQIGPFVAHGEYHPSPNPLIQWSPATSLCKSQAAPLPSRLLAKRPLSFCATASSSCWTDVTRSLSMQVAPSWSPRRRVIHRICRMLSPRPSWSDLRWAAYGMHCVWRTARHVKHPCVCTGTHLIHAHSWTILLSLGKTTSSYKRRIVVV